MVLLPQISPEIFGLLAFTPLQYMLRAVEYNPKIGMVYADDKLSPSSCAVRIGPLLFFGGEPTDRWLSLIREYILTIEVCERYGYFYCFYPDSAWREALTVRFPDQGRGGTRSLYRTNKASPKHALPVPQLTSITKALMNSEVRNREMITGEVTTYSDFDHFLRVGIGYALVVDRTISGFCTSEYQSEREMAIGIEVVRGQQRRGYAKALTDAFLRDAAAREYTVYWECSADNAASVRTALSCGFAHGADYPVLYLNLADRQREKRAPEADRVDGILRRYLPELQSVRRVPEGASTYVYRVKAPTGTCYARFLPEAASFAAEVLAHRLLLERGVTVPPVILFEHREERTGLSMMLAGEIPGSSLDRIPCPRHRSRILREAGRQLALIHTIPVEGFGWIDRDSHHTLKGERRSFYDYFTEYLENDLVTLGYCGFSMGEMAAVERLMEEASERLDTDQAVLVHGDFDTSHIFHFCGEFSGLIDFGEIRGNNRLFDLATFALNDDSPDRADYGHLLAGYREAAELTAEDLRGIELMALFIALRFVAKKVESGHLGHWRRLMKGQLERLR